VGEVLVQALYSGVSRGTESLVFTGRVPPGEHARMRGPHQEGEFTFPIKYGYAAVGRIVQGPGVGRIVFCLHPHQTAFCVSAADAVGVPDGVPPARAVLAANMETALNAIWDARVGPGDRVVVVGAGAVGCLTARLAARIAGCEVQLVDIDARKATVAAALHVSFGQPQDAWGAADVVFHASASQEGLQRSLEIAGPEATVVELSWYGDRDVRIALGGAFHPQRLRIVSSQVGAIPPHRAPRWTHRRRLQLALALLQDDALDVLFSGESTFDELPAVMAALVEPEHPVLCHRIRY
jgi:threonine dehydrogenase-like Zn-dependent dehydrogenase